MHFPFDISILGFQSISSRFYIYIFILFYFIFPSRFPPTKKKSWFSVALIFVYVAIQKHCRWYQLSNGGGSLAVTSSAILSLLNPSAFLYPFVFHFKGGFPLKWVYFNQMHVSMWQCSGYVIYRPRVSDAKWSEQQLLARLKDKPPQGEGYTYGLTPHRQRFRCVLSGFWGEREPGKPVTGSETVRLCWLGVSFVLRQWMLENATGG